MAPSNWYLESANDVSGEVRLIALRPLPFLLGRRSDCDLTLESHHSSQRHAEFFLRNDHLWLRDLGSTNGTSVNGQRLTAEHRVEDGDLVHFADCGFRLVAELPMISIQETQVFSSIERQRLESMVREPAAFQSMLMNNSLKMHFQPLIQLQTQRVIGYEVLGRGELDGRLTSPAELFFIAEKLQREVALSVAFREHGVRQGTQLTGEPELFINTHPNELRDHGAVIDSLRVLRERHPSANLVLEIHEAAVADLDALKALRSGLEELQIALAFDDFGTGQARLLELIEVQPKYLKFDAVLIEEMHLASKRRREMVKNLVSLAVDMEIITVAECIETKEEAEACAELGFELAQGYYFGRPAPVQSFL